MVASSLNTFLTRYSTLWRDRLLGSCNVVQLKCCWNRNRLFPLVRKRPAAVAQRSTESRGRNAQLGTTLMFSTATSRSLVLRSSLLQTRNSLAARRVSSRVSASARSSATTCLHRSTTVTASGWPQLVHGGRLFSTTGTRTTQSTFWTRLAKFVRYTRIPLLVVSVYQLGYQQGIVDCTKTPLALEERILKSILMSAGTKDLEKDVQVVSERDIRFFSVQKPHQVAAVGQKIIEAARAHIQEELAAAMAAVKEKLPEDIDEASALKHYDNDKYVDFWQQARLRIMGEEIESRPWQYIFIQSSAPNAFVTEILPRRFFITSGMLEVATTADELAMVLGHEVSHLIMGHVSQTNQVETMLRTVEVLFLSLDPTAGLVSLAVIGALAAVHKALAAAHSRENEREADDLGVQLAAKACFDTVKGVHVMRKMHEHSIASATQPPSDSSMIRMMDTHPPSMERFRHLQTRSQTENPSKYVDEKCATVSSRLYGALWGTSRDGSDEDIDKK